MGIILQLKDISRDCNNKTEISLNCLVKSVRGAQKLSAPPASGQLPSLKSMKKRHL